MVGDTAAVRGSALLRLVGDTAAVRVREGGLMGLKDMIARFLPGRKAEVSLPVQKAEVSLVQKSDGGGSSFQGVPAFWFARAIEVGGQETLNEPYRNSVWVQRAIKTVAGPISAVAMDFFETGMEVTALGQKAGRGQRSGRGWNGRRKRAKEEAISVPEMETFLRGPMAGMGYADFVEAVVGWLKLRGEVFWIFPDDALVPFPEARTSGNYGLMARPDRMRHLVEDGELIGWTFNDGDGQTFNLLPEQVVQGKYWNPYNKWRGLGEYDAAQIAAEGDWLAGKFSRNLMANNGDTGPYIVAKNGVPSDPQREQIITDLKAKRAAQLRGDFRPIFMTGDISVEDPQVKSVDGEFIGQRLENRHEIYLAFGVPPSLADVKAAYSIGSASDFYQLIANTCVPCGSKFCDWIERLAPKLIGRELEAQLDWDDHPVFQEVRKERLASVDSLWNKGMPLREVSDYLGLNLPQFEGDDVGYLPISVVPVEQALEPEPAPGADPSLAEAVPLSGTEQTPKAVREMLAVLRSDRIEAGQNHAENGIDDEDEDEDAGKKAVRANRKTLWEAHMRRRSGVRKAYRSKVELVLNVFRGEALKKLASHGGTKGIEAALAQKSLIDFIFNPARFGDELVAALSPVANLAIETAVEQVKADVGKQDDPWKMPSDKALAIVRGRDKAVRGCGQAVRSQLNTALEEGYQAGESTEQLMDRVRAVFGSLSKYEAKRIAVTETAAVFGKASHETMAGVGVQYKTWLSSHGPHVRPAHAAAEAQYGNEPIPIDEPFVVGGEELMHPGDPAGSAENVINCECVELAAQPPKEGSDL